MIHLVRKLLKKWRVRRMRKLIDMPDGRLGKSVRSYFGRADKALRFVRSKNDDYFEGLTVIVFVATLVLALISFVLAGAFKLLPVLIISLVLISISTVAFSVMEGFGNGIMVWLATGDE